MNDFQKRVLDCAEKYLQKGWRVLPLHTVIEGRCTCGKENCPSAGKHPVTLNGVKDASCSPEQIRQWFAGGRMLNIGIAAGAGSGLAVLDIDPKNGGNSTVLKYSIPDTLEVITGSGGRHFYFTDLGGTIRNSASKLGSGLDVRGEGGYVAAPPSLHISGKEYRWTGDFDKKQIAPVPEWMVNSNQQLASSLQQNKDGEIAQGQRNATLCSIAGAMRRQGCDAEAIYAALINVNQRRCRPPLGYDELSRIARSVAQYPAESENILQDDHPETLAAAFYNAGGGGWRYNSIDGWSVVKNEKYRRVEEDQTAVALRRFLNDVHILKTSGGEVRTVRFKKSGAKVKDILAELAAMEGVHIPPEKHSPACLSGTLNPQNIIAMNNCLLDISGNVPKAMPLTNDFYTLNYLPFDYDPDAECPCWKSFLAGIFTRPRLSSESEWDKDADDFVEKYEHVADEFAAQILGEWFGYLITHDTHLQKIFALLGERRSGKSTIGKVLRALIGNANTASPTLTGLATEFGLQGLLNKTVAIIGDANTAGCSGDVARAVERLKSISGEDGQQVNRKNKTHIEIEKMGVRFLLIANKMQDLRDSTGALASRFNFLVTTQTFLGREDHGLETKLLSELPGIFNWAIEGLNRLRHRSYLPEHPAGIESREDFEQMTSPMKAFVEDWCIVRASACVPVEILWKAHQRWADENGNKSYSKRKFIIEIKGACSSIRRERRRVELSHLSMVYNWDRPLDDNRTSCLAGIDLKKECRGKWDKQDSGTGCGTGYPFEQ